MARFTAFASESSDDEDHDVASQQPQKPALPRPHAAQQPIALQVDEDEDADEGMTSDEEEVPKPGEFDLLGPPRGKPHDKNALVRGQDGEYYHAHEVEDLDDDESHSESSSESPPPNPRIRDPRIPWAQQVGADPHRVHLMQASLFKAPQEAATLKELAAEKPGKLRLGPSQGVNRKHDREPVGDGLRSVAGERTSFAHDVEALPFRPSRKYARVEGSASAVSGTEDAFVDAGLALGRSFRVGWGPGGTLVHLGQLCSPSSSSKVTANSSVITKTVVPFSEPGAEPVDLLSKLLSHHLSNSPIEPDADGIPFANPSRELRFESFASLFPSTDRSFEASLFRLGEALFDESDLLLSGSSASELREHVYLVRRRAAITAWLEDAVASTVEAEVKADAIASAASTAFKRLTGHQVELASEVSIEGGNLKLATLISQAGGDDGFVADMRSQLQIWREQRIDVHIDEDVRKVYALLAGIVDVLEGSNGSGLERCPDLQIAAGLDWKRVFGLYLWYSEPLDTPVAAVFKTYREHWTKRPDRAGPPIPWYLESSPTVSERRHWRLVADANPPDALYAMLNLFSDEGCSLSYLCQPLSFGRSPLDFSLPWHLYIMLSRVMRLRDFPDRDRPATRRPSEDGVIEDEEVEGHSPSADLLASSYALQLEQLDMIQEAVFVLLHLESSTGREKAIKDLLLRSAPKLDDWMTRGIAGSLKIPISWVNEAKAIYALNSGQVYEAYQLYLNAGLYNPAHELAVLELSPEAVIRDDLELVKSLFERFADHPVDGWNVRGKVFLDYARIRTQLPELRVQVQDPDAVADSSQAAEFEDLIRIIPRLIGILPDVLRDRSDPRHNVALSYMVSELTRELDKAQPLALSSNQLRPLPVNEATKLSHAQVVAYAHFLKTIQAS
ncbi:hypothetical protein FA95DRAFT_1553794 [Auriscalpium vulgare]|uniref:Uncharacterized protein n=1 Tax=Auriscalpium vulgare TaxID=40419 RepID=A0ACB8S6M8_9AGAM|nr:hypothetical protein FA95DRAFT_1553794 [Auriscalpium vulgare]